MLSMRPCIALWLGTMPGSSSLFVYPAISGDGTVLGNPTILSMGGHRLRYSGFAATEPRSGARSSDRVDLVFPSGRRSQVWVHLALRLP